MGTPLPLRALDLFSGVGGLSLGWLMATKHEGGEVVGAVDADPSLVAPMAANFPTTKFLRHSFSDPALDHATIIASGVGIEPGEIDALLAGPPCQSVSSAGKRSASHPDNRLALRVAEVAAWLKPKLVVIENVPDFAWVEDGRLLGRVRVQLSESGYHTEVGILNASSFGVPQIRQRCFVLAIRKELQTLKDRSLGPRPSTVGAISAREPLPANDLARPPTVAQAIDDLPTLVAGDGSEPIAYSERQPSDYALALRANAASVFNHVSVKHSAATVSALSRLRPGETPQLLADHPLNRKAYFRSAYARLVPDGLAPTMTTQTHNPGSGRFTHYSQDRVLTVREVARLQSFPDNFRFFGDSSTQRRHVGNAVPPLLAAAIFERLLEFLPR